jgi:hypothetical protein
MRVFVLAAMLLASSSLGALAQEPPKAPLAATPAPMEAPASTDQKSPPQPGQNVGREQQRADDREMGRDWKMRRSGESERSGREDREIGRGEIMRRGDDDRMGRDEREMGGVGMMRRDDSDRIGRDRDTDKDRGRYMDRGRYQERGDRDWDRADRDRDYRGYADAERPRRRVKICVEYENGDEYCRYRE